MFLLELAEAKAGHRLRILAFPHRYILTALIAFGNEYPRRRHLHTLRNAESHIIQHVLSQVPARIIGIPIVARYRKIVSAAGVNDRFFAFVRRRDRDLLSLGKNFGQDDREIAVFVLVLLNKRQRLAVCRHTLHPQGPEQVETHDPQSLSSHDEICSGFAH